MSKPSCSVPYIPPLLKDVAQVVRLAATLGKKTAAGGKVDICAAAVKNAAAEGVAMDPKTAAFTLGYLAGARYAMRTQAKPIVCVTGGSGYIAGHVCKILVESGNFSQVRATTRRKSPEKTGFLEEMGVHVFAGCDLMVEGSFLKAFAGCTFVIHCASPFQFRTPGGDAQKGFVDPALKGTLNVLNCAKNCYGSVKRVVLTSSCAAISWGDASKHPDGGKGHVWTEDDWQEDCTLTSSPYRLSKRLAEQAAWKFVGAADVDFDLAVICPAFVLGPVLSPRLDAASVKHMKTLLDGSAQKTMTVTFGTVDVRDVAQAHVNAIGVDLGTRGLKNKLGQARFILSGCVGPLDLTAPLRADAVFSKYPLPAVNVEGAEGTKYSHARAEKFLGIRFRDLKTQMIDGARSLVEYGIVKAAK